MHRETQRIENQLKINRNSAILCVTSLVAPDVKSGQVLILRFLLFWTAHNLMNVRTNMSETIERK